MNDLRNKIAVGFYIIIIVVFSFVYFTSLAHGSSVGLAWDHPAPASVAGYKLHFGPATRQYTQEFDVGNALTATLNVGVGDARQVYIAASCYDAAGNPSGYSNEVVWSAPDDKGPDAPSNLRLIVQMSRISDTGTFIIDSIKVEADG